MNKTNISLDEFISQPLPPGFDSVSGPLPHTLLNDLMFRIVFESNQNALKALLCSLLHLKEKDIVHLEIQNPINLGKHIDDKTCIFDIKLEMNNSRKIHLELQVLKQMYWTERSLYYLCQNFGNLNVGEDYKKIKPLVQIDILDFELYEKSKEFYSVYHLADDKTGRIYSDKLALHVLQLKNIERATAEDKAYKIDYWARLFKATTWEELKMLAQEYENLRSTVTTIYRVNADEQMQRELFAREDQIRLKRTMENELKEKDRLLAEQETVIAGKDAALVEKETALAEKDVALAEKETALAEKDVALAEKDVALVEKETALAEKDAALVEQKTVIAEKDAALEEKDTVIESKDAYIAELEAKLGLR